MNELSQYDPEVYAAVQRELGRHAGEKADMDKLAAQAKKISSFLN